MSRRRRCQGRGLRTAHDGAEITGLGGHLLDGAEVAGLGGHLHDGAEITGLGRHLAFFWVGERGGELGSSLGGSGKVDEVEVCVEVGIGTRVVEEKRGSLGGGGRRLVFVDGIEPLLEETGVGSCGWKKTRWRQAQWFHLKNRRPASRIKRR